VNVVLIGMKHCGKSTLGAALAARWGCPFYDVDRLIEERHACETGPWQGVRDILNARGEGSFAELETQVVCDLYLRLHEAQQVNVVALGGRTALNRRIGELLTGIGLVVYLEVSPEEMFARVLRGGLPAFVDRGDPIMHFLELYQERVPHYQHLAHLTVNLDGLDPQEALEKLCRRLEEPPGDRSGTAGRRPRAK